MDFSVRPIVGDWYLTQNGQTFEVVAVDEEDGTVEIQYFDGDVEEIEFNVWRQMAIVETEPPEDWSGAMDMMREDFVSDSGMTSHEDWASPLDTLDAMEMNEY